MKEIINVSFPIFVWKANKHKKKENLQRKKCYILHKKKHCKFQFLMHNIQFHKYKTYYIHRKYSSFVFITLFILIFFLYSQTLPYPSSQFSSLIVFMSSYIIFSYQKKKKKKCYILYSMSKHYFFCNTQPRQPRASTLFYIIFFFHTFVY